ncbi:hypothetical protein MMC14_009876 [Varicellaria rhodocarpa]|nr:hypothetical protein [Varicellaria rhodocarpa]
MAAAETGLATASVAAAAADRQPVFAQQSTEISQSFEKATADPSHAVDMQAMTCRSPAILWAFCALKCCIR